LIFVKFFRSRFQLCFVFLIIALVNLAMNVFFTGTHERYLYHCYPFLIIAFLLDQNHRSELKSRSNYFIPMIILSAICYGSFVFGSLIKSWVEGYFYQSLTANRICALIHITLLITISTLYFNRHMCLETTEGKGI
ncbi:MAG: hypothetical protein ACKOA8_02565, partial [Deltaproteobacteria bacterium]